MGSTVIHSIPIKSSVFLESVLSAIIPAPNDDSRCLFAISLFYAMLHNEGINPRLLEAFSLKHHKVSHVLYSLCVLLYMYYMHFQKHVTFMCTWSYIVCSLALLYIITLVLYVKNSDICQNLLHNNIKL